jgi:hypothetical protein
MKSTTPIQDRLDNGFKIIAIASLDLRKKPLERDDIEKEAVRIERCVEHFYKVENHDLQYPEYATKFLNEKFRDIIEGKYDGEWLDGIKDVNYVEESLGE